MKFVLDDKILLGGGQFAQIFHATRGTEPVAAKKHNNVDVLLKEADFLKLCDHPNVLRYIDLMEFGNMTYLITEFAREGNLQGKLGLRKFAPNQKTSLVRQLCRGLVYLHSKNILHRNIAPGNILFKNSESIVISDFSKAVDFVEGIQVDHNEPLPEKEYTLKSDVFLLALVVFQIFEDRRTVNRKTLADEIQEKAFSPEGLCREIFEKKIWVETILNSLFWKANKRPTAINFHNAFKD